MDKENERELTEIIGRTIVGARYDGRELIIGLDNCAVIHLIAIGGHMLPVTTSNDCVKDKANS